MSIQSVEGRDTLGMLSTKHRILQCDKKIGVPFRKSIQAALDLALKDLLTMSSMIGAMTNKFNSDYVSEIFLFYSSGLEPDLHNTISLSLRQHH